VEWTAADELSPAEIVTWSVSPSFKMMSSPVVFTSPLPFNVLMPYPIKEEEEIPPL
jgi:hypothetical protein